MVSRRRTPPTSAADGEAEALFLINWLHQICCSLERRIFATTGEEFDEEAREIELEILSNALTAVQVMLQAIMRHL
jgi:hypothetical protein